MLMLVFGIFLTGAGVAGLWYFKPRNGRVHPLAVTPLLDSVIPVVIVSLLASGLSVFVAGLGIQ